MLSSIIIYALYIFFVFYIFNYAEILDLPRKWFMATLPTWMQYSFRCAFCFSFWVTLALFYFFALPLGFVFTTPPLLLFCDLTYKYLKSNGK